MVVVLDTNHFRELVEEGSAGQRLLARIDEHRAEVLLCIAVAEESFRGWLALLNRHPPGHEQLATYAEFQRSLEALTQFAILPFDQAAADSFASLRRQFPRAGTMDLKIASIASPTRRPC
jgi:tRNA(fMet)-specific endonuclease VapC